MLDTFLELLFRLQGESSDFGVWHAQVVIGLIAAALMLIVIVKQIADEGWVVELHRVFWLESLAVVAFGVSWLTKGEILFKDEAEEVNNTLLSGHR